MSSYSSFLGQHGALFSRILVTVFSVSAVFGLFYTSYHGTPITLRWRKPQDTSPLASTPPLPGPLPKTTGPGCTNVADVRNIAISVKTGATESMDKLPTQLMTSLRCVPDPMLFSDLDQTLGDYQIHDVLSRFSPGAMEGNSDFDIYHRQKELVAQGRENQLKSLVSLPNPVDDWHAPGSNAAWALDKYKFLHMVERAWELQPDRDWYVFIEADAYLSLSNLVRWLGTLNPKKKLYFGKPVRMWEHRSPLYFGYGGSGVVLSGAAVREFAVEHKGLANSFDYRVRGWWFGDFVLADALDEVLHLRITNAYPSLNSDEPATIPFGESIWCQPAVTLHHMDLKQFNEMYQYEKSRNFSELLFRDVYNASYIVGLPFKRDNWDNLSDKQEFALEVVSNDPDKINGKWSPEELVDPHRYFPACEHACIQNERCFQFSFVETIVENDDGKPETQTKCHLSKAFRLGEEHPMEIGVNQKESGKSWTSGWRSDRIAKWVAEHQDCRTHDGWF